MIGADEEETNRFYVTLCNERPLQEGCVIACAPFCGNGIYGVVASKRTDSVRERWTEQIRRREGARHFPAVA